MSAVLERPPVASQETPSRPWVIFALASVAQFMVVLDASIMNVALPSIQRGLGFSQGDLQWVINIYVLFFGGFLLLGGRSGDIFGRRRMFMVGLALFSVASLAGGLAQSPGWLVAARAVQGLGGAIISAVALAIITSTFTEGSDRNRALGIYGSIAGFGGAVGVLLGGILTSSVGWQWVLYVNVPVGVIAIALSPRIISRDQISRAGQGFDLPGAFTVTASLVSLVYGVVKAPENGWGSVQTLGFLGAAAVLMAVFVAIELRSSSPVVRLSIFRMRSLLMADISGMLTGAAMFAMFFFISLYLQDVLGYSALKTGFAYLPMAIGIIVAAGTAAPLVTRLGYKPILAGGMLLAGAGLLLLSRIRVDGLYQVDVLPAAIVIALGLGFTFVPLNIAAVSGVEPEDVGLASGLINTFLQVGGALGLAVLSTVSTSRFNDVLKTNHTRGAVPAALVDGFHYAFLTGAGIILVGAVLALVLLPRQISTVAEVETLPATA